MCKGSNVYQELLPDLGLPITWVQTLVIGSGASGLNAAVQLVANGVRDVAIVTEGLQMGTSIYTGSDKQTYYKPSMIGEDVDSPVMMAESYFAGGSVHGDLALVEASVSARAFLHLVNLGVPFPRDEYGQFVGYKTDHDPRQRATSIGPYTSREMCRALIRRVEELGIPVLEHRDVVQLLVDSEDGVKQAVGALAVSEPDGMLEAFGAENVVLAVGGPGGLYRTSVYPQVHTGAIGLALLAGAAARNLPESQYGLASIRFRWNVSGTFMQVIPRFISTDAHMRDEYEFMRDYFDSAGQMNSFVFLKGYQWPFDARKVIGGSSLVDILVYIETVLKKRRVFLDFCSNPQGFSFDELDAEALSYLTRSDALLDTPFARLSKMNPAAIELYREHGIDIAQEPLEIAVCAQHNNGGLAGTHWWESTNIKHLFPVGEVNGSHGVYRPGGSALNAGQVGAFRAAEYIAHRHPSPVVPSERIRRIATEAMVDVQGWLGRCQHAASGWQEERLAFQDRMSRVGAHIRSVEEICRAVPDAWAQFERLERCGCAYGGPSEAAEALRNRQLCFAHAVYLEAIRYALESGVGSRGSAIALDQEGIRVHDKLGDEWRIAPEDAAFRKKVLETVAHWDGTAGHSVEHHWVDRHPIPRTDAWFETAWARFREGRIYEEGS
jgi:succinate dehydrogenase/fumarate reductase flavoprotein subunit